MSKQASGIYKVTLPCSEEGNVFAFVKRADRGLAWLKEQGREDAFINVYNGQGKITFVLNDLQTALLMRLSLQ